MNEGDTAAVADEHPARPDASLAGQFAARPEATQGARAHPHHRGNAGSWAAVTMIIIGFALGAFALPTHSIVLWIATGAALVVGGILALCFRIMDQVH
ncbi:hypothetical protein [Pseudofrankia asymbiotica]|nr:hypothetical protein [Pseudofrankia asymbiotica]